MTTSYLSSCMCAVAASLLLTGPAFAGATSSDKAASPPQRSNCTQEKQREEPKKEQACSYEKSTHSMLIGDYKIDYDALVGTLPIKDKEEKTTATVFFTAYFRTNLEATDRKSRPLMFCFNGGPGSSSVWLHLGFAGPKKISLPDLAPISPPASYADNPQTLLEAADLVFIDPVSTGFSRPEPGADGTVFYGVDGDINACAEFIRLFLTQFDRWGSPRFLMGESYGTIRAVGLAEQLQETEMIDVNGLVLLSSCLDFQAYVCCVGNDLPYPLMLPSYAAAAWYHKRLAPELQAKTLQELLAEVEQFALSDYVCALAEGDALDSERKESIVRRLSAYTGLSMPYIRLGALRIPSEKFFAEFARHQERTIGRFDARWLGISQDPLAECATFDPSFTGVLGPFHEAFLQYVRRDLKYTRDIPYYVLNMTILPFWSFAEPRESGLGFIHFSDQLRALLTKNPPFRVFVASGIFDLATPYFASEYVLRHLHIDPATQKRVTHRQYEAGHMMYLNPDVHVELSKDVKGFLQGT